MKRERRVSYRPAATSLEMMPKTSLQSIQRKIQQLQKEAERIRGREVGEVIAKIRSAIEHYRLRPEELFGSGRRSTGKRAAAKTSSSAKRASTKPARRKVAVKYRDTSGNTWTGRGSQPRWLVAALKEGKKIEDFAVKR